MYSGGGRRGKRPFNLRLGDPTSSSCGARSALRWVSVVLQCASGGGHMGAPVRRHLPPGGAEAWWISVQSGSGQNGRLFLQIGLNLGVRLDGELIGEAFWSDGLHDFRPVVLGQIKEGDEVHGDIKFSGRSWKMTIQDLTGGWSKAVIVRGLPGVGGDFAGWTVEDPVLSLNDLVQTSPMIDTGRIRVTNMQVNLASPTIGGTLASTSFVKGRVRYFPTDIVRDSFYILACVTGGTCD